MSPPPQTPTPRRFVFPKRQPTSTARTNRFVSTPRFNPPSSSARPPGTQLRNVSIEDVEEEEERVEMSPIEGVAQDDDDDEDDGSDDGSPIVGKGRGRGRDVVDDAIEVFSQEESTRILGESFVTEDHDEGDDDKMDTDGEQASPDNRANKRRKLSITPLPAFSSPIPSRTADAKISEPASDDHTTSAPQSPSSPSQLDSSPTRLRHAQPTFHPAPRFKTLEDDAPLEGLPAAFLSPQRKGQRYLSGGLAAELQGWASQVRKPENSQGGVMMRVQVGEVRSGRRMYLVRGKGGESVVLAGEGRLQGLGRRAVVEVGSLVVVGSPVWDAVLEGETWIVACAWSVD